MALRSARRCCATGWPLEIICLETLKSSLALQICVVLDVGSTSADMAAMVFLVYKRQMDSALYYQLISEQ